jgi:hypothetical protein
LSFLDCLFDDSSCFVFFFMAQGGSRDWERNEEQEREQFWHMLSQQDASCRMWFLAGYLRGQADAAQLDPISDPLADYPFLRDTFF